MGIINLRDVEKVQIQREEAAAHTKCGLVAVTRIERVTRGL
jgi:hypothetical protein